MKNDTVKIILIVTLYSIIFTIIHDVMTPKQVNVVTQQSQASTYDIDLAYGSMFDRLSNWTMLTQLSADAVTGETIVISGESHCDNGSYHVHIADGYNFAYELKNGKYPDDGTEVIVSGTIDLKEEEDGYGEYYVKDGVLQNVK